MKFNNLIIFLSRIKIILIEPNSKKSKKWNFMRLRYFDIEVWVFHIWIHTAKIQYLEHRQDYKFFIWVVHMVFPSFDIHILKLHFLKIFSKLFCLFIHLWNYFQIAGSRYAKRICQLETKSSMCFHKIKMRYMENRRIHK